EHALLVAQSLLERPGSPDAFARSLARRLRRWLLCLPAGVGLATLRACVRLWLGFGPGRSGVPSAGNGPATRSPLIGAFFRDDEERLRAHVEASTRLTHTDPRALVGALAAARCAAIGSRLEAPSPPVTRDVLGSVSSTAPEDSEWLERVDAAGRCLAAGRPVSEYADELGLAAGVSGCAYHTVPVAIYAWLRHWGDFRGALEAVLGCGGDADTLGAITGALSGALVGEEGIPREWIEGVRDWPRGTGLLREAAGKLGRLSEDGEGAGELGYFRPAVLPRNLLLLAVVLFHGFRRLLPPY
ncbi:MAG: ADP-ribosylglycohydrolase family protein, partial [Planctomycetota bacterium]